MHAPNSGIPDGARSSTEGETGYVFVDDDPDVEPGPLVYSGVVQPGGFLQITPDPLDLPAIGAPWYLSVGTEEDGAARSTWLGALNVVTAGDATTPNIGARYGVTELW